jgi:hypothetical protein
MMYSGDEELSDQEQNPFDYGDEEEYDHEFQPDEDEDGEETDECAVCGYDESDPIHQDES